jgi:hypothetical protein
MNMFKKLIVYMLIGTAITIGPLYYINNVLLSSTSTIIEKDSKTVSIPVNSYVKVPGGAKNISLLYDSNNLAYLDSGNIYVKDVKKDTMSHTIVENTPILYARPLDDRGIIMYFTYDKNKLEIRTYDVDKQEKTLQKSISVKNLYEIKDVKYSSLTNLIYIDVVINENKVYKDTVFRVDIMKEVSSYIVNKQISELELLNNKDTLVYQDVLNNVFIKGKQFQYENNKKYKLLGVDKNDIIYLVTLDSSRNVLAVNGNSIKKLQQLDDINFIDTINSDNTVYLIYKDYILDLITNSKVEVKSDEKIIDINNDSILLENTKNEVSFKKI